MRRPNALIRNADQSTSDIFLVSAVATVLLVRIYLEATGYPRIGGGGLHIAHVLWGGFAMLIGIGILLSFLLPSTRRLAALIGGIGFGAFIDELGKFLTSDNNYFFKPTAALIYTVFIALYFLARRLRADMGTMTPQERLVNAIELAKDLATGRLSPSERRRALLLLEGADPTSPLTKSLRAQFQSAHTVLVKPSSLARLARLAQHRYLAIVTNRWFRRIFAGIFVLQALATLLTLVFVAIVAGGAAFGVPDAQSELRAAEQGGIVGLIDTGASILVGIFTIVGVVRLWHRNPARETPSQNRVGAYQAFEIAILIDLLLFQPFSLLSDGFAGVAGVLIDLALLGTLRFMLIQERHLNDSKAASGIPARVAVEAKDPVRATIRASRDA